PPSRRRSPRKEPVAEEGRAGGGSRDGEARKAPQRDRQGDVRPCFRHAGGFEADDDRADEAPRRSVGEDRGRGSALARGVGGGGAGAGGVSVADYRRWAWCPATDGHVR